LVGVAEPVAHALADGTDLARLMASASASRQSRGH
jgi:hypothetical protein